MEDGAVAVAWYDSFRGQVVVVTGASSGIGRATALAFAAAGARVVLMARRRDVLDEVAELARASGAEALVVPTDVTERAQVQAAFAAVDDRFGRVDVVVNNAGILLPASVLELDPADLDRMLRVNLFGALFVMQESVRRMRARKRGCVVNVASLAGRRGVSPLGGYCASKFALVGLTEALRTELHGEPVHVALVLPGVVETPMVDAVSADRGHHGAARGGRTSPHWRGGVHARSAAEEGISFAAAARRTPSLRKGRGLVATRRADGS